MTNTSQSRRRRSLPGISSLSIKGYKALAEQCSIEIRPLTILAGANSAGKSSLIQPLLMLKQTLEVTYDPGALLLYGPNVRFTSGEQLLSKLTGKSTTNSFTVGVSVDNDTKLELVFVKQPKKGIDISEMRYINRDTITIRPGMSHEEIQQLLPKGTEQLQRVFATEEKIDAEWRVERSRCFLSISLVSVTRGQKFITSPIFPSIASFSSHIRGLIHVPGLRGNPERTYKTTAIGSAFPGTFEEYVASVINHWQTVGDDRLKKLGSALETLGLTWKVEARQVDDTQVELRVGRMLHSTRGGAKDMVNIADVGFGVSQTLPVLVALLVAERGQMVYLEQPEIHLHPRAQAALAQVIADAARRGVRVVVETHSSLLLRGIQTLVAKNELSKEIVKLHWFKRRPEDGATEIISATLDEDGSFGDWPEDFDEVALNAEKAYLDAAEMRMALS